MLRQSALSAVLEVGPVYHVLIKYPDWMTDSYLGESPEELSFASLEPDYMAINQFYVRYFLEPGKSTVYFSIQSAFSQKWITHKGPSTRRHSPPVYKRDGTPITSAGDFRLFYCALSLCDHKGGVAQIPGTDLYLNGEMTSQRGLSFHRVNYLTFLATDFAQTQPFNTGHDGVDWSLGTYTLYSDENPEQNADSKAALFAETLSANPNTTASTSQ